MKKLVRYSDCYYVQLLPMYGQDVSVAGMFVQEQKIIIYAVMK